MGASLEGACAAAKNPASASRRGWLQLLWIQAEDIDYCVHTGCVCSTVPTEWANAAYPRVSLWQCVCDRATPLVARGLLDITPFLHTLSIASGA